MSPVFLILFAAGVIVFLFIVAFIQLVVYLVKLARPIKKQLDEKRPVYDPAWYKSRDWKALRYYVLARNNFRCAECGGKAETAHHRTYDRGTLCPPEDLQAVCWPCHNKIEERVKRARWN